MRFIARKAKFVCALLTVIPSGSFFATRSGHHRVGNGLPKDL
jgi:hypothetical protein